MRITRRGLQLALGGFWLLDAALQFQPYMFTRAFGADVLASAGDGQPGIVSAPVHWGADLVGAHPVLTNAVFATVQLVLALGLFSRRTARVALIASAAWGLGVWSVGEGFGGLLSGHAMLLSGAPGAALLYVVVAVAAYPAVASGIGEPPRRAALGGWVGIWLLGAVFQLLPGQNSAGAVADAAHDGAEAAPSGLSGVGSSLAGWFEHQGVWLVTALVVVQAGIALLALRPGAARRASVAVGAGVAVLVWVFVQGIGELATGQSTDPNTGPLLVLLALAVLPSAVRSPVASASQPARLARVQVRERVLTPAA